MSGQTLTATPTGQPAVADLAPAANDIDGRAVTTLRLLAADMVEAANSGHPGMPMGAAPAAWAVWSRFLRHDPTQAEWPDRDRFVLSAGHGSALLYGLLHLFGYLPMEQLRRFRQDGSLTPGHPEAGVTPGVETTTGPLGQGIANAVGMALAERMMASRCNVGDQDVVNHRTWVIVGDGCLMEGISHEAASLAGHLGLGRLIVLFDDNNVTIDGYPAGQSCGDDVLGRFAAYGWQTLRVENGNDVEAIVAALDEAVADESRPTLVSVRTIIGYGAPTVAGTPAAHGTPLGAAQLAATRRRFGWPDESFHVPDDVRAHCAALAARGQAQRVQWEDVYHRWRAQAPELADRWPLGRQLDEIRDLDALLPRFEPGTSMATRKASAAVLRALTPHAPSLIGGSADLASSTGTDRSYVGAVSRDDFSGATVHFGIREHAMASALNGLALHGGVRPFGSTFLVFSDYLRPALRLSSLMELPVLYILTHDSIAVGEDGPTHQPIEHVEALRLIPGVAVLRPADANETAACWALALRRTTGPTVLVLSRQDLPVLDPPPAGALDAQGAWAVYQPPGEPDLVLAATGSEVSLAIIAAQALTQDHRLMVRVVSIPWRERFAATGTSVLVPAEVPCVWIEAGVTVGWRGLARPGDDVIGLDQFGASGPGPKIYARMGFTAENIAERALACVRRQSDKGRDICRTS